METNDRAEADRLLAIADGLLRSNDLNGARDFSLLAQETDPLIERSDQIIAIVDVLTASNTRINNQNDWYAILQLESGRIYDDMDLIKSEYRRLGLLLHPEKNDYAFADSAFRLVSNAWDVLSDPSRKMAFDNILLKNQQISCDKKMARDNDLAKNEQISRDKIPVRRADGNIWTVCPYCYNLYEYPKVYDGCCLRCMNCEKAFQVVVIPPDSLPLAVPGKEEYYCCWGNFPMGFATANSEMGKGNGMMNWMSLLFPTKGSVWPSPNSLGGDNAKRGDGFMFGTSPRVQSEAPKERKLTPPTAENTVSQRRGRPKKNRLPERGV
uniref:uncharacterized protein LOC122610505 n=1 Tax=Erigeron canadensis TaxID=72917 RepID=UPI001CB88F00|nr:uncharacterized protein LOC122610505 [Erigeron canadensis]